MYVKHDRSRRTADFKPNINVPTGLSQSIHKHQKTCQTSIQAQWNLHMAEEAVEAQAEAPVEVEEEIFRIDHEQDRYRIERVDP